MTSERCLRPPLSNIALCLFFCFLFLLLLLLLLLFVSSNLARPHSKLLLVLVLAIISAVLCNLAERRRLLFADRRCLCAVVGLLVLRCAVVCNLAERRVAAVCRPTVVEDATVTDVSQF